jgi:putative Holliday junction resolvase
MNHTYLGFDFGTKRIGVAVGQSITQNAQALSVVNAERGVPKWEEIGKIIKRWHPAALVVGIPFNMDGSEQALTEMAKNFSLNLFQHFARPIYGIDERLTSIEVKENLFREKGYRALKKASVDCLAAQLILTNWLLLSDQQQQACKLNF